MLGLAAGDAMGAPVEGLKAGHISQLYGRIQGFVDPGVAWGKKPGRWRMQALYTDDTQQSLALADSLLKCRGFNPEHFAELLARMARAETGARFGAHRGTGKNFRASVRAVMDGLDETGMPSAGIGAMMRVAPCGLYFARDREALMRAAIQQGLVTHTDPRALVMACVQAFSVSMAVTGEGDHQGAVQKARDMVEAAVIAESMVEKEFIHRVPVACMDRFGMAKKGLDMLPGLAELPEENMAYKQIVSEANRQFPMHKITEPGQGFVMASGLSALYIALTSKDYETGVLRAVHLGKDTDTMAAIAGAILGARYGEESVPEEWRRSLVNAEQPALRGEALFQKSADGPGIKDLVEMESGLTAMEQQKREELIAKLEAKGEMPKTPPRKIREKQKAKQVESEAPPPGRAATTKQDRIKKRGKRKREKPPWKK